jgi:hypothetical protein
MRTYRIARALLCLISVVTVLSVKAQQCDTVLTATGRNYMHQLSTTDQAAWYYKHVCEGSALDFNGNYTDESKDLWSQAKTQLGLSYSQQKTYCSTEASHYASYAYASLDTSTVMASSTAAWLKCIELTRKGIGITPTLTASKVTFAIQKIGKTNGVVNGVDASLGITCSATVRDKSGVTTQVDLSDNKLDHDLKLADVDTMTILCKRQFARDNAQATFYPVGDITVVTSEGPLTVELDADTLGKELWASQVVARMAAQTAALAALRAADAIAANDIANVKNLIPHHVKYVSEAELNPGNHSYTLFTTHIPINTGLGGCATGVQLPVAIRHGSLIGEIGLDCRTIELVP